MTEGFVEEKLDPHYLGYFDCFNRGLFFEAHDVLEELWLKDRRGPNGAFYKGLIQLAGAFVHLQKNRLRPAAALFKLALANLEKYPHRHEDLNLAAVCSLARKWISCLESAQFANNPLADGDAPKLALELPYRQSLA
jgi:predicted metal-dependent hydrolase